MSPNKGPRPKCAVYHGCIVILRDSLRGISSFSAVGDFSKTVDVDSSMSNVKRVFYSCLPVVVLLLRRNSKLQQCRRVHLFVFIMSIAPAVAFSKVPSGKLHDTDRVIFFLFDNKDALVSFVRLIKNRVRVTSRSQILPQRDCRLIGGPTIRATTRV